MRLSRQAFAFIAPAVIAVAASSALAQQKPDEPQKPDDEPPVRLLPKDGGWKIDELFDQIHKTTGISILFDSGNATFKQAKVEFIGEHIIRQKDLFDWLQAVLSYRKLVLVPVGPKSPGTGKQQWFVMDQADPNLKSRPVYIDESDIYNYADRDGLYVVTTLTLVHINDTTRVRNALSPLSTQTAGIGRIQDIPGSRALIVGDFAPVVAAMKKLLSYIDVPNSSIDPHMEVIPLNYEVASELEPIITDLIQANEQGRPAAPRPQGAPDEEPQPKIIADNRLDALIIYATDSSMTKVKDLILKLDIPSTARGRLHFRPLKHTDSDEMATLLEDLINSTSNTSSGTFAGSTRPQSRTGTTNRSTPPRPSNTGGGQSGGSAGALAGSGIEGAPVIISDRRSNSLIIQASPTQWGVLDTLIARLDQSRPQVLIETSLVELQLNNDMNIGVELFGSSNNIGVDTNGDGKVDAISNNTKGFGTSSFGLSSIVSTTIPNASGNTGDPGTTFPVGKSPIIGTGLTAGIFHNGKLPFILNAFQSAGRARILTQPSLVTNDNEQATISLERQTSYKQTIRDNQNTSTDSFQQITAKSELSISPHISSDNYLRLDITQSVSNFGARASPDAPPDQTTRKVDTHVTLPDTYTVVLGGIIQEEESTSVRKVPFLGDLPILGFFFRQTEDQSNPSHLFLFVTPRILRDTEKFADYHKLTWEKKLLQDDLFGSEVVFPKSTSKFGGPDVPPSAMNRLKQLELSDALDAGVLKAPQTDEDRVKLAEQAAKQLHEPTPAAPQKPAEKPAETPPEKPPEKPAEGEKK
jgi:general secretion pathway protein D